MNPKVDKFLNQVKRWRPEFETLRAIVLECTLAEDLNEDLKWGWPSYSLGKANVILIHGFKQYCALMFFKGSLLRDPKHLLVANSENMQATRQLRFSSVADIVRLKATIKAYILEAIEVEKAGLKVQFKKTADFAVAPEFQNKLDQLPALKAAFQALTPGRQRAYLLHFAGAKQPQTRESRVAACMPQILKGKGLND